MIKFTKSYLTLWEIIIQRWEGVKREEWGKTLGAVAVLWLCTHGTGDDYTEHRAHCERKNYTKRPKLWQCGGFTQIMPDHVWTTPDVGNRKFRVLVRLKLSIRVSNCILKYLSSINRY
ncbi:hypothetical protein Scep_026384 [Stephania cephalantha]|uniref:Uncharacterized protein n=1 Tax=Stephania cephalantha TaxID=152367 RepID=A0AAP0EK14_9MAGN